MSVINMKVHEDRVIDYTTHSDHLYRRLKYEPVFLKNKNLLLKGIKLASALDMEYVNFVRVCEILCFLNSICTSEGIKKYSQIFEEDFTKEWGYKNMNFGNVFVDQFYMLIAMKLYYTLKYNETEVQLNAIEESALLCYLLPRLFEHPTPQFSIYHKQLKQYCDVTSLDIYDLLQNLYKRLSNG